MVSIKKVVVAQHGRVQTAGCGRTRTPGIDTRGGSRIGAEEVARPWPAVLEDAGSSFPLGRQGATDRVAHQVANVTTKIQAGQRTANLRLRREHCRGHAITDPMPRASSRSAIVASTVSSWSASRTGTVMLS